MSDNIDLSKGDFVYQADQELFLVVMDETENSYKFAVHGWREIGKQRLDEYISHDNGKLYKQGDVDDTIEQKGSENEVESFEQVKQMFDVYTDSSLAKDGPQEDFKLEDT